MHFSKNMFTILNKQGRARTGILKTRHGEVKTPAFLPVATKASVKALSKHDLDELGAQILISNTYHLLLQPGNSLVKEMGGLHKFMNWDKPIMTDSGGFQAFSLGYGIEHNVGKFGIFPGGQELKKSNEKKLAHINDDHVEFKCLKSGIKHKLSPEKSIRIQQDLDSDIILVLDECTSPFADYEYVKNSLERTHRWAKECLTYHDTDQAMFGIIQGSTWEDLRRHSCKTIASMGFDGFAIGGSLGKEKKEMHQILDWCNEELPEEKPKHLLGIGIVEDIIEGVKRGCDTFDCVGPTKIARSGYVYIDAKSGGNKENKFRLKVTNLKFKHDDTPLDPNCDCKMCKTYTRSYVHHLFKAKELLAYKITSYHNIHFMLNLMKNIRKAINENKFDELYDYWLSLI